MTTDRLIAVALIVLCCAPITFILLRARMVAWWHRVMSRLAVEVRRARPVRREGKHTDHETRREASARDHQWAIQLHDIAADLDPLPVYDEGIAIRERYRREAWAATGVTQAEYWAQAAPDAAWFYAPADLPGPVELAMPSQSRVAGALPGQASDTGTPGRPLAGEPQTPNQAMNLWRANDVIPPRIAATLARATADQTVIDTSHATLEPYIIGLTGGDPFDGLGQDEWLDRLFAGAAR